MTPTAPSNEWTPLYPPLAPGAKPLDAIELGPDAACDSDSAASIEDKLHRAVASDASTSSIARSRRIRRWRTTATLARRVRYDRARRAIAYYSGATTIRVVELPPDVSTPT